MDKKIKAFDDTQIENPKFHCHKNQILIDGVDIKKIIVSYKVSFGKKKVLNIILVTNIMKK